jgi:hypothetical protein
MSEPDSPPTPPGLPPVPRPAPLSGWITAIMIIVGIILLLPGLCALVFGAISLSSPSSAAGIMPFVVVGLLVGFGGVMLIRAAIRGRQR